MKYILLATLFIQTNNGQISIQKDLNEKTCKHILNTIKCRSNCLCIGLDENDEMKYVGNNCSIMTDGSYFKQGECLK